MPESEISTADDLIEITQTVEQAIFVCHMLDAEVIGLRAKADALAEKAQNLRKSHGL